MSQMRCACVSELRKKRSNEMRGEGILSSMRKYLNVKAAKAVSNLAFGEVGTALSNLAPSSDNNARPMFPGEQHAFLKLPNGKIGRGNYIGPGTQVVKRLARGDPGRNMTDNVAKMHDIQYSLAKDLTGVRKADERMVKTLKKIERTKGDSRYNTQQGMRLIQAKMKLEDLGVDPNKFASFGGISSADRPMLEKAQKQLEQEGYGGKKKKVSKRLPPGVALRRKLLKNTKG